MKDIIIKILLISLFIFKIKIYEPVKLSSLYNYKAVEYAISNFGDIPFGHSLNGTVYKGFPSDGCSSIAPIKFKHPNETLILFLVRGNCHFSQKVLNAQKIGARFVIIGDNIDTNINSLIPIEKNYKLKNQIYIPSIILSNQDSNNFSTILDEQQIELSINFNLNKQTQKSIVEFVVEVEDYNTLKFISSFLGYKNQFKDNMIFLILFRIYDETQVKIEDSFESCKYGYCVEYNELNNGYNKEDKIKETINHICLNSDDDLSNYKNYLDRYLREAFEIKNDNMVLKKNFAEISNNIINSVFKSPNTIECLSYPSKKIKEDFYNQKFIDILYTPQVRINNNDFKGNLNKNNILEIFCNSFVKHPANCNKYIDTSSYDYESASGIVIQNLVYLIVAFLIIISIFYIGYRRKIKREFNDKMSDRINGILNKYYNEKENN